MTRLLGLVGSHMDINSPIWPELPKHDQPLVMIANHPFGIGDGICILSLAEQLKRPFKVLIHRDLLKVPEIRQYSLPIDFSETRDAVRFNLQTRNEALQLIRQGVTIVIFPAGGVATAENPFGRAEELPWKMFAARLVQSARASVLPVYFEGQNSWLFHAASHFSETLRLSLLVSEFRHFAGNSVKVNIGRITPFHDIAFHDNRNLLIRELYNMVHRLGDRPTLETISKPGAEPLAEESGEIAFEN